MNYTFTALATTAALALSAAAASAQAVSCGGVGATGQWIGGSPEASDISTSEGPLFIAGLPIPAQGNNVVYFSVSTPGEFRLEAQPNPTGDSVIEVYDANGTLVVTDDDSGGGLASRAETQLQAGEYCLATRGWAGGSLNADVQVGRLEHEAITQGLSGGFFGGGGSLFVGIDPCTSETPAIPLGTGPIDGQLGDGVSATNSTNGAPYYRFVLDSAQPVSITAENPSADPYIYVFDGNGTLLAENDDYQSLNSRIDFTSPLQPGTYCIGMRALSDPNQPVTLSVVEYDAEAALHQLYDIGDAAPPLDGSYPIVDMGELPSRSVRDQQISGRNATWFSFTVPEGGAIVIDAVEVTDSDPLIILYNDIGQEIAFNDDSGGTLNSQIVARVNPGRYLLAVRQYSDSYQGIIRIATERYVPAP
ncbi:pre-peptidase C-terminal domain-containing protein [Hasllibacter sp. MH4015]|uniref:pre-peptidase C-terminal domain-containing protein n=1 Tax=Hasllibacter sp. MH4015 TaxID=2854029 RepID=UPI001CD71756|nr:pre-peptidase C-terminal domain-containing protein [Hasllibacter sp. MH4015]